MDGRNNDIGLAAQTAKRLRLQARILWIDCTANIDRYNTPAKIETLLNSIEDAGFNTIVFDIKPISGQVIFPSKLAPKLTEWRGRNLPVVFDPVGPMVEGARKRGLAIYAGLNSFSEGHQMFGVGPGYALPERQTVLYEPTNVLRVGDSTFPVAATTNTIAEDQIGVVTQLDKLPANAEDTFIVSVDRLSNVVDGFESPTTGLKVTMPRDGVFLVGRGAAADFLHRLEPGTRVQMETATNYVRIGERPKNQIPLMMNPHRQDVQEYAIGIMREVMSNYAFDGAIYDDRMRYGNIFADFSEGTRADFETHIGKKLTWPDDVFRSTLTLRLQRGVRPGRYYEEWLSWRAETLRNFLIKVRKTVADARPGAQFGCYAGSWYGDYLGYGSNWASPQATPGFWFLNKRYSSAGFAPLLDFLITGCYYQTPTIYQAMERGSPIGETVEAAGMLTNRLVRDDTWSYAGIMLSQFQGDPKGLGDALQAACGSTQGVMVFDLSHEIEPMWPVFKQAFAKRLKAPHQVPGLLAKVRQERARADKRGVKDLPIPIIGGASGTGH